MSRLCSYIAYLCVVSLTCACTAILGDFDLGDVQGNPGDDGGGADGSSRGDSSLADGPGGDDGATTSDGGTTPDGGDGGIVDSGPAWDGNFGPPPPSTASFKWDHVVT